MATGLEFLSRQNELMELALAEIYLLACEPGETDCEAVRALGEKIARRVLACAHRIRIRPSAFSAPYERKIWEDYLNGELKAAGMDVSAVVAAQTLMQEIPRIVSAGNGG